MGGETEDQRNGVSRPVTKVIQQFNARGRSRPRCLPRPSSSHYPRAGIQAEWTIRHLLGGQESSPCLPTASQLPVHADGWEAGASSGLVALSHVFHSGLDGAKETPGES